MFNAKYSFSLDSYKLILFITFYYSVFFLGALPSNYIFSINNIFLVISPGIVLFLMRKYYKNSEINIYCNVKSIILSALVLLFFFILNSYSKNLFIDEIFYAHKSNRLALEFFNVINTRSMLFQDFDSHFFSRIFNFLFLGFTLLFLKSKFLSRYYLIGVVLIIVVRLFIWSNSPGIPFIHSPLNSFIPSVLLIVSGFNDYIYKISGLVFFIICNTFIFKHVKFNIKKQIVFYFFLFIIPILSNNFYFFDQSVYFPIFLFYLIILFDKISLKNLSILVGISILFRQSSIVLFIIPLIKYFYDTKDFKYKITDTIGVCIGIPIFIKSLIYGTPASPKLNILLDEFNLITSKFTSFFDNYHILYLIGLIILWIYLKDRIRILILISVLFLYILIFSYTRMEFGNKYIFEFFGAPILLFIYYSLSSKKIIKLFSLVSIFLIMTFNQYEYIAKDNNYNEILKSLENNISETLFLKHDYNDFSKQFLNSKSDKDYLYKFKSDNKYDDYSKKIKYDDYDYYLNSKYNLIVESLNNLSSNNIINPLKESNKAIDLQVPKYIVFMENNFLNRDESKKEELLYYYNILDSKSEDYFNYGYTILELKSIE